MNRYFNLLTKVAAEYHIQKGTTESELAWKARIVYSLLSQMGYSALYDTQDDLKPASIVHLKNRISNGLRHLMMMYPELVGQYDTNEDALNACMKDKDWVHMEKVSDTQFRNFDAINGKEVI